MNRGRINQGLILVLIGLFFLLRNLGWVDESFLDLLWANWPVLLIFAGVYVMFSRSKLWFIPPIIAVALFLMLVGVIPSVLPYTDQKESTTFAHELLDGVTAVELEFSASAANFTLREGTPRSVSGSIDYAGSRPMISGRQIGDRFVVELRHDQRTSGWRWRNITASDWETTLPPGIPTSVSVAASVGDLLLDMRGIDVRDIDVSTSLGRVTVLFDHAVKEANVTIDAALSEVEIVIPEGIGMRIRSSGALISDNIDRLGLGQEGQWYVSPGYASADRRVEVDFTSSLGSLRVSRRQTV